MFPRIDLLWRGVAWKQLFRISSVLNLLKYLLVSDKRELYCKYYKYKWNWLYFFGEQRIYLLLQRSQQQTQWSFLYTGYYSNRLFLQENL